jgi:hypothetical protein
VRHRIDLLARDGARVQDPVSQVHAPAADLDGRCHIGQVTDPLVELRQLGHAPLPPSERLGDRQVVSPGAVGIEYLTELLPEEPGADPVRERPGRLDRYAPSRASMSHPLDWFGLLL